jgi:hypothetical protein
MITDDFKLTKNISAYHQTTCIGTGKLVQFSNSQHSQDNALAFSLVQNPWFSICTYSEETSPCWGVHIVFPTMQIVGSLHFFLKVGKTSDTN